MKLIRSWLRYLCKGKKGKAAPDPHDWKRIWPELAQQEAA